MKVTELGLHALHSKKNFIEYPQYFYHKYSKKTISKNLDLINISFDIVIGYITSGEKTPFLIVVERFLANVSNCEERETILFLSRVFFENKLFYIQYAEMKNIASMFSDGLSFKEIEDKILLNN